MVPRALAPILQHPGGDRYGADGGVDAKDPERPAVAPSPDPAGRVLSHCILKIAIHGLAGVLGNRKGYNLVARTFLHQMITSHRRHLGGTLVQPT